MKKVYILAYSKMNLGDDLFIDILLKRYTKVQFYSRAVKTDSTIYQDNENLHFLDYNLDELLKLDITEFDAFVYIGGSIFMEHAGGIERVEKLDKLAVKCREQCMPFYYISSNFGPYETESYKNIVKNIFYEVTDVCLRDKKSYELFKKCEKVRYAPDAVFSAKLEKLEKEKNTIGISTINFKFRKDLEKYKEKYNDVLIKTIDYFTEMNYKVKLFSFCEYEGDSETNGTILKNIKNKEQVESIVYNGDLKGFLRKYSQVEYMICSRFHSMVLSYIFEQKMCVLSYSSKTTNVINDLNIVNKFFEIDKIDNIDFIKLEDFEKVRINENIIKESNNQFKKLDEMLINDADPEEKVTVIIPARNEEKTVQKVIRLVQKNLFVNQIIVVDNNSTDHTAKYAKNAGAEVIFCKEQGKGYAMEEGLKYAQNDIIVYLDADISNYSKDLIIKLVTPIMTKNADFVKSMFDRKGGRVTELVAKPMMDILFPDMYKFSQPLSGMIAGRKELFLQTEFEKDYGVDIGILLDVINLGAKVQEVHIGKVKNVSQQLQALNKMSKEVMLAILKRANY